MKLPNRRMTKMTPKQFIKWRRGMGLTQDQAAKLLGLKHRSSICHIEKGNQSIPASLAMCCRMLQEQAP